ncbi:MAG: VanW family protein [Armatimonadetes bacterium]|nr:VanW family protein [Armatimonadota bacterium]
MSQKKGKVWPKVLFGVLGIGMAGTAATAFYLNTQFVPTVYPNYTIGDVSLLGKTEAEAKQALSDWWEAAQHQSITMGNEKLGEKTINKTLADLEADFNIDDALSQLAYNDFVGSMTGRYPKEEIINAEIHPDIQISEHSAGEIEAFVDANQPAFEKARVTFDDGAINRRYEAPSFSLKTEDFPTEVLNAYLEGRDAVIPLTTAKKSMPDGELDKITTVVSQFTTSFSSGNVSRSTNIKVAAQNINGHILLPGEEFSFNDHLGQRTIAKGYKTAGVYVSGRHDFDVGGGICQVSTTMYNALLLGNMEIESRSPHSLPVPYVPLGRDAAVSFPNPDLKFKNNTDHPMALSATYAPGKLTFRVLGSEKPEEEISFETKYISSWSNGEKIVHDGSLKFGQRKVVDNGGSGRKVRTWKIVKKDGKEVERVLLGDSIYRGGPKIIAVNKNAKAPVAAPASNAGETAPPTPPAGDGN